MRMLLCLIVFSMICVVAGGCSTEAPANDPQLVNAPSKTPFGDRRPVLVELFTSEGCSSCPPADRNLAFLATQQPVADAEIITLAFHVDYWDRLGWKDRFSSSMFSQRQESYAQAFKLGSNYTPQMVVDGRTEFVGSDSAKASGAITAAAQSAKALVEVHGGAGTWQVKITDAPEHSDATVFAAIAEDGLSSRVERGENSGKMLEHVSVVRELKTLGALAGDKSDLESSFDVRVNPEWEKENVKVVVFVQENQAGKVIGVGSAKLGGK